MYFFLFRWTLSELLLVKSRRHCFRSWSFTPEEIKCFFFLLHRFLKWTVFFTTTHFQALWSHEVHQTQLQRYVRTQKSFLLLRERFRQPEQFTTDFRSIQLSPCLLIPTSKMHHSNQSLIIVIKLSSMQTLREKTECSQQEWFLTFILWRIV